MDRFVPPLWLHQREAVERAGNRFALFFDPGTGKTRTALELFRKALGQGIRGSGWGRTGELQKMKALVFAPLNVCRNWEREIQEYLCLPHKVWLVSGQTKPQKMAIIQGFRECVDNIHMFLIVNTETLRAKEYRELLSKSGATFVVVDESHNFKSPTALQTKGLFNVLNNLRPSHLYLLTGTPAPQGEIDLWSTFALLGRTNDPFFVWRKRHFEDKNERRRGTRSYWPDYQVRQSSRELFSRILAECSQTARKNEVLDLPPLLRTQMYCEMGKEQARYYETMFEYLFAVDTDGNELNASNLLSRTLRLQQILAGFLNDIPIRDNPRLDTLREAIDKIPSRGGPLGKGEQFIIWTIFKPTYKVLGGVLEERGISYGLLTGEQHPADRHKIMDAFQSGQLRALIAHPKAGGVGVNLTAASYSLHYTRSYNLVDDLQAEARNYRGGSERHERITRIDIVTPDTIDEDIMEALRAKRSVQDFILGLKRKHGH